MSQDVQSLGISDLLLVRRGLVFLSPAGGPCAESALVTTLEIDLGLLGYSVSHGLRAQLAQCTTEELTRLRAAWVAALSAHVGAQRAHVPLHRHFPASIPDDTRALWWRRVGVHFLQADGQACLTCHQLGTTHVLSPCCHVICEHCWDGSNYAACPVCGTKPDSDSPFFQPAPERPLPIERVTFRMIDLGGDLVEETRLLFQALCLRTQALSPDDKRAVETIVAAQGAALLAWLPERIPVKEVMAQVLGSLLAICATDVVLPVARLHLRTATDVLRLLAVLSGQDASLQPKTQTRRVHMEADPAGFWRKLAFALGAKPPGAEQRLVNVPFTTRRFKVARLSRRLRRSLLALLEAMEPQQLVEDMLRHSGLWIWVGEFLHPGEYRKRFPQVARAFEILRGQDPQGKPAPAFQTRRSVLEESLRTAQNARALELLQQRPGELGRRLDHLLRLNAEHPGPVVAAFKTVVSEIATPLLVNLGPHLSTRHARAPQRVYWPKSQTASCVLGRDSRSALPAATIAELTHLRHDELLRRFQDKPRFATALLDAGLANIVVPFNERTASAAAVQLPRGSRVRVPSGKTIRLFLHWCDPAPEFYTDIDLSVAFFDAAWSYLGVCSYYQLAWNDAQGRRIAASSGDFTSAPPPDGATEFVDIHPDVAREAGARHAVMVVSAYSGLPFSKLERAFAGVMVRDDVQGAHFDPRTVALRFSVSGDKGTFAPLTVDLDTRTMTWLDVYSRGQLALNNVANAKRALGTLAPSLTRYFQSGARCSMLELSQLHAAARCDRVILRAPPDATSPGRTVSFERRAGESPLGFFTRLRTGQHAQADATLPAPDDAPVFAALYKGDVSLPPASAVYALFRETIIPTLDASDLLA